jgi:hypothetical protein
MIRRSIVISVIAPITVAGILFMAMLAAISLINQAFALCVTHLSLGAYPKKEIVTGTILSGTLKCGNSGIGGASITVTVTGESSKRVTTDDKGNYDFSANLGPGTHTIEAHYAGNEKQGYGSTSATKIVQIA